MTNKELREKSPIELQKLLAEQRAELNTTRFKIAGRQETKVSKIRQFKRTIAAF